LNIKVPVNPAPEPLNCVADMGPLKVPVVPPIANPVFPRLAEVIYLVQVGVKVLGVIFLKYISWSQKSAAI